MHLLDAYSKNSDGKIFNCTEYLHDFYVFAFLKRNKLFLCYEEEGLVGVAPPLLIRKYIQCSKLSMIMADVLAVRTSKATSYLFP